MEKIWTLRPKWSSRSSLIQITVIKNHLNIIKYITYYKNNVSYQNSFLHHFEMLVTIWWRKKKYSINLINILKYNNSGLNTFILLHSKKRFFASNENWVWYSASCSMLEFSVLNSLTTIASSTFNMLGYCYTWSVWETHLLDWQGLSWLFAWYYFSMRVTRLFEQKTYTWKKVWHKFLSISKCFFVNINNSREN